MDNTNENNLLQHGGQVLSFICSNQKFGFDILCVTDIIEIPDITPMPLVADYICGVINLRGKVVPIIDFNKRMGLQQHHDYDDRSCIVIVETMDSLAGVLVERIYDAENFVQENFTPSPLENSTLIGYLTSNDERITLINSINLADKN